MRTDLSDTYFKDLANDLIRCEDFRWLPGMLAVMDIPNLKLPYRLTHNRHPSYPDEYDWPHDLGLRKPDLTDSLTLSCLLELVERKHTIVYGGPVEAIYLSPGIDIDGKSVFREVSIMFYRGASTEFLDGKTKAEALIIALESDILTD